MSGQINRHVYGAIGLTDEQIERANNAEHAARGKRLLQKLAAKGVDATARGAEMILQAQMYGRAAGMGAGAEMKANDRRPKRQVTVTETRTAYEGDEDYDDFRQGSGGFER